MEVGAVKQAFNNELILMKKKLNQAKIQVIHKLTRKAKTLTDKKVPDKIKEKLNKKAESAVKEVLIIKKIKVKDLAKFMITHTDELKKYLNRPAVDHDKACARLALHKVMQDKYRFIRGRFGNVPIKDLFMSRQERIKLKKEAKEKQKSKRKEKDAKKISNTDNEWKVEDIIKEDVGNNLDGNDNEIASSFDNDSHIEHHSEESDLIGSESDMPGEEQMEEDLEESIQPETEHNDDEKVPESDIQIKFNNKPNKPAILKDNLKDEDISKSKNKKKDIKAEKNQRGVNKNKNFNEKLLQRKFKKDFEDSPIVETKVVDPFFITSTGERYMSVAEPRQPDEIKEIHKQGNRKFRRATMFGHVPKVKPRWNHFEENSQNSFSKSNSRNKFDSDVSNKNDSFNDRRNNYSGKKPNFNNKTDFNVSNEKPEKLHPSWEAKKRQSSILPFQGKKIVFDES